MAGTFAPKLLAEGQLPTSVAALYTVPGATSAYVRTMKFAHSSVTTQTILVHLNGSGTNRGTYRFVLAQNESAEIDDHLTLETGDSIQGETTTATTVDYTIHGVEET